MVFDARAAGLILSSYLGGAIPAGYLVVLRLRGFDIRDFGSGNPGTANVYRVAGPLAGIITLVVDALKGYLPVLIAVRLFPENILVPILCGSAAIVGHNWTIFLGFRGGKGVATSAGVFAALMPKAILSSLVVFAICVRLSGHISIGSLAGAVSLPAFALTLGAPRSISMMASGIGALILVRHIPNIKRLFFKKELSLYEKK